MKNDEVSKRTDPPTICKWITVCEYEEPEQHKLDRIPDDIRHIGKFKVRLHFPCENQMEKGQMESILDSMLTEGVQNLNLHIVQKEERDVG